MFKERLGLVIEKEDEISCAVGGCNFLLRAISHEAFTFTNGQSNFLTFPCERARPAGARARRAGTSGPWQGGPGRGSLCGWCGARDGQSVRHVRFSRQGLGEGCPCAMSAPEHEHSAGRATKHTESTLGAKLAGGAAAPCARRHRRRRTAPQCARPCAGSGRASAGNQPGALGARPLHPASPRAAPPLTPPPLPALRRPCVCVLVPTQRTQTCTHISWSTLAAACPSSRRAPCAPAAPRVRAALADARTRRGRRRAPARRLPAPSGGRAGRLPLLRAAPTPSPPPSLFAPPQVDGDGQFTRISGSSVGGGTFWGLCSLLTGEQDFDKILALSATGNNANVSTRFRRIVSNAGLLAHGATRQPPQFTQEAFLSRASARSIHRRRGKEQL